MIKYKVEYGYNNKLTAVEVERETDKCVWFKCLYWDRTVRELKVSSGVKYFDSFDEAKLFLVDICGKKLLNRRGELQSAEEDHEEAQALTLPQPEQERKR